MKNQITVIIPCYNNFELTKKTLLSLNECTESTMNIIIVDDNSTDETEVYFKAHEYANNLFYIRNDQNKGVNASWNIGLKKALELDAPYICISNNDMLYTKDWDTALIKGLDTGYSLVSPYSTERDIPSDFPNGSGRHINPNRLAILGCCFMFKKELIDTIGFFPEEMVHYYGDNWIIDICSKHSFKIGHIFESYVHHLYCKTTGKLPGSIFNTDTAAYKMYCNKHNLIAK
jgi:glycosyltransferase involved in cell wall biosynthesis